MIDIDNFRLLNDNHGHEAGDQALLAVAQRFGGTSLTASRWAATAPTSSCSSFTERRRRPRAGRRPRSDQPGGPQPSVRRDRAAAHHGQRRYRHLPRPRHIRDHAARGRGAGTRGGEGQRRGHVRDAADRSEDDAAAGTSFDVLQGLVIAVDTKDRYTKRHSEDVARYATFLARRIDMPADEIRTLAVAGLLHDIGRSVSRRILRKPGQLTEAEYAIVKQHVALGDMIVRDLPDVAVVRAGIRHHHERWDGQGYLDRLEGEAIPLIARILAVADAFSAMTTTRPYRKALDVREASRDSVTPPGRSSRSASSSLHRWHRARRRSAAARGGRHRAWRAVGPAEAGRMRTFGRLVAALTFTAMVIALTPPVTRAGLLVTASDDTYSAVGDQPLSVSSGRRPRQRLRSGPHGSEANRSRARDRDRPKRNGSFTYQPAAAMSVTIRSRTTLAF